MTLAAQPYPTGLCRRVAVAYSYSIFEYWARPFDVFDRLQSPDFLPLLSPRFFDTARPEDIMGSGCNSHFIWQEAAVPD